MKVIREVEVEIEVDLDEALEQASDEELRAEMESRGMKDARIGLQAVWEDFRGRGDAPKSLRDYIYEHLGKIL